MGSWFMILVWRLISASKSSLESFVRSMSPTSFSRYFFESVMLFVDWCGDSS